MNHTSKIIIGFFILILSSPYNSTAQVTLSAGPTINALIDTDAAFTVGFNGEMGIKPTTKDFEIILRGGFSRYNFDETSSFLSVQGNLVVLETVAGIKYYLLKKDQVWNESNGFFYIEGNIGANHYLFDSVIEIFGIPTIANGDESFFRMGGRTGYRFISKNIGVEIFGGGHAAIGSDAIIPLTLEAGVSLLVTFG